MVVIGGGVIGLSIAWTAAVNGMAVTVVDPAPGRGASWAAAGMLAPVGEAYYGEEALIALNLRASREWPQFARALETASGESVGYRADGTLLVAVDPSDQAATVRTDWVPAVSRRANAGGKSPCWLPGSEEEPSWPTTTRWTIAGWSTPSRLRAGPTGLPSATMRCRTWTSTAVAVTAGG